MRKNPWDFPIFPNKKRLLPDASADLSNEQWWVQNWIHRQQGYYPVPVCNDLYSSMSDSIDSQSFETTKQWKFTMCAVVGSTRSLRSLRIARCIPCQTHRKWSEPIGPLKCQGRTCRTMWIWWKTIWISYTKIDAFVFSNTKNPKIDVSSNLPIRN